MALSVFASNLVSIILRNLTANSANLALPHAAPDSFRLSGGPLATPLSALLARAHAELVCAAELTGDPSDLIVEALRDLQQNLTAAFAVPEEQRVLEWFGEGRRAVADTLAATQILVDRRASFSDGSLSVAALAARLALESARDRSELATSWTELEQHVMAALATEVAVCDREAAALDRTPLLFSLPSAVTLEELLLLGSAERNLGAPALSAAEREFYALLERLQARLLPLRVLMELLTVRVDDFKRRAEIVYPSTTADLAVRYAALASQYEKSVVARYAAIEHRAVAIRWQEVCAFVVFEVMRRCDNMIAAFESTGSSDAVATSYKTCAAGVGLIQAAVAARVVRAPDLAEEFNAMLLPRWRQLNSLLGSTPSPNANAASASSTAPDAIASPSPIKGLRLFRMTRSESAMGGPTPRALPRPDLPFVANLGSPMDRFAPGLDLGLGVNPSPSVPFSVQVDRVIDLSIDASLEPSSKSVHAALLELSQETESPHEPSGEEMIRNTLDGAINGLSNAESWNNHDASDNDEVATLVHEGYENEAPGSPNANQSISAFASSDLKKEGNVSMSKGMQAEYRPSKIPLISANYACLGLPVIKKNFIHGYKPTRIPSISPSHPVFISPERRAPSVAAFEQKRFETPDTNQPTEKDTLRSPVTFDLSRFGQPHRRLSSVSSSGTDELLTSRSRSSSLKISADKMTLLVLRTPDLTCGVSPGVMSPDRVTLRSSSPERPESSIGSRYDAINLTKPLKPSKKSWR